MSSSIVNLTRLDTSAKNYIDTGRVVFGMPFRYNALADPNRNTYNKTFMADGPIITIVPGIPRFRRNDEQIKKMLKEAEQAGKADPSGLSDSIFGASKKLLDLADDAQISQWLLLSQKKIKGDNSLFNTNADLRYYHFEPSFKKFREYLDVILYTLAAKMGVSSNFSKDIKGGYFGADFLAGISFDNIFNNENLRAGLRFYAGKNVGGSTSISTSYGQSMIAGAAKGLSDMAKEAMFVFGFDHENNLSQTDNPTANTNAFSTKVADSLGSVLGTIAGAFGGTGGLTDDLKVGLTSAVSGANIIYPEIWKDSSFSKSISASFNFISPYGTPEAIFQYVYLPFCILLTLAAPRQVGTTSISAPFLLRVDCPGKFTSDLAAITSMDWTIGGNEGLFSKDGLPLAVTVNISIKDLYPSLMIADDWALLRCNTGIHSMLDNMAGLSSNRYTPIKDILDSVKARTQYAVSSGSRQALGARDALFRFNPFEGLVKNY